ncbi:MAG: T9SS type A sorting domain-containing protein [Bacteroidetes bacterium]|nr:T9SS type A sorting domain-containing protein [Bacteroidota bacterium]
MKIPLPIRTSAWKIFGSVIIFLLFTSHSFAQASCAAAQSLTPSATCTVGTSSRNGSLFGAVNAAPTGSCGGATSTTTYSQWYKFTASGTSQIITITGLGSSLAASTTYAEVLSGTCGSFTPLICQNVSSPIGVSGLTSGTTYYVRVYVTSSPTSGVSANWAFTICALTTPSNDNCAGATSVTVGSTATGTMVDATSSGVTSACSISSNTDVWYKFSATGPYPIISFSALGANMTNASPIIEVYSGTCGSLTSLGCTNGTTYVPPGAGLTTGTTYYIRVSDTVSSPVTSGTYTFTLKIANPTATAAVTTPSTASPTVDYGKSYVNISKGTNGGTAEPGDTLEMRATFVVKTNGTAYNVQFKDNIPANTTYIPGSLKTITNEGKTYQAFGDSGGDNDGGTISGTSVTINMGINASPTAGGFITYKSKPSFYGSTCIIVASYRVVVNSAATYGMKVPVGYGSITFNNYTGTTTNKIFPADTIMVYQNYGICTNTVGSNAIISEYGGTFGSGTTKDRVASSKVPSNYTYSAFSNSAGMPNDYYYGVSNNTSGGTTVATGYTTSNAYAYPTNPQRIFGVWDIIGDHTGAASPTLGNPPTDDNAGKSGGYLVAINASYRTDTAFLDTIYNLCPNTYYQYSAWFRNICPKCGCDSNGVGATSAGYIPTAAGDSSGVYPNLTFNINGYDYYTTGNILHTGQWIQKGFTYLTGPTQTSMVINIRNNAPGGGGNDWVIDDIGVATCAPNIALTPNKPDTLCMGADDTVRFKVSSFFNNYTQYQLQKSIDGGVTWTSPGIDTTGAADNGTGVPVYNSGTGNYEYTVARYYRLNLTDTLTTYRLIAATTVSNLSNSNCSSYATAQKIVIAVDCMTVLPTNIILFKGHLDNGFSNLQWVTTNETANITYTVERSYDQLHFEPVASFAGTAPEGLGATYNFTDPKVIQQPTYYRIHLVSGKYEKYSSIVLLSNTDIDFNVQSVTNPFNDWLAFDMTAPDDAVSTFTIFDTYGRVVKQERQSVSKGYNNIKIYNLGSLASGTYTLQVQYNDRMMTKRVIKLFTN